MDVVGAAVVQGNRVGVRQGDAPGVGLPRSCGHHGGGVGDAVEAHGDAATGLNVCGAADDKGCGHGVGAVATFEGVEFAGAGAEVVASDHFDADLCGGVDREVGDAGLCAQAVTGALYGGADAVVAVGGCVGFGDGERYAASADV